MSKPFASVIVITRNRAESLARTLDALARLTYPAYEVVVVDNGSTDATPEVARARDVKYVRFTTPNMSLSRQAGVDASRGEVLAMCDDDCVPSPDWLDHLAGRLQADPSLVLVGGHVVNIGFPEHEQYKGRGKLERNGLFSYVSDPAQADYFGSANLAFSRRAIEAVGGYDPFFRGGYEEIDLIWRIRAAGFGTAYAPEATVDHHFTGANFKLRPFYSGALMRLYFYLRHLRPGSPADWARFAGFEAVLCAKEVVVGGRKLAGALARSDTARARALGTALFNSVSARAALPWVAWEASSARRRAAGAVDAPRAPAPLRAPE